LIRRAPPLYCASAVANMSIEPIHIYPSDAAYPAALTALTPAPELWLQGTVEPDDALAVAIVGARRASAYGLEVAEQLASDLAARGVTVVSGFARGIDTAAHRGALAAGGRTIAVLGAGIDVVYPPENVALAREVAAHGALLTQFAPGMPPLPQNFPTRNRTLAALALGVVVVEAAERSGSLITAGFAGDLGREVFAVPGKITSPTSSGTHKLLRDGATLVERWSDVVQELPEPWRRRVRAAAVSSMVLGGPVAGSDEARMLGLLSVDEAQHIERLIARAGTNAARVGAILTSLELGGWARQLAGQRWIAVGARSRGA
jgi:DNA processing protein